MTLDELPPFLQERFLAMKENVREAMLQSIDQGWVDCQVASHELMKGIDEGKWTLEDIRNHIIKTRKE